MENIKSIISNNPFYLAQLSSAPEPVRFDIGGMVKKVDNSEKFLMVGLLGIVGVIVIYILWSNEKKDRFIQSKDNKFR